MDKQFQQKPLSNLELSEFFRQISMLLHSGISVPEAFSLLLTDTKNEQEKELLTLMLGESEFTGLLYPAARASGVFPAYALSMIRLAEETGTLDDVLDALSGHYVREENFRQMIRSAFLYPCIMLVMMFLVVLVLITKVLPIFQQVFIQLGQEMTGFSAGLLAIGENLSRYSLLCIAAFVLLLVLLVTFGKRLPFLRGIQEKTAACRFADGMAIALKSGMTPEQGLDLSGELADQEDFRKKVAHCKSLLSDGCEFSEALTKSGILSGVYARTAYIAGKTGRMEEAMEQISSEYEQSVNNKITRLISTLEPSLVILLSFIVGIILFSVMIPLLGIMAGL